MYRLAQNLPNILIPWYRANARDLLWRRDREPYHVWVSEIMLQQTRVEAVTEHYRIFLEELPDIKSLAEVSDEKLYKLWQGLGYYRRADNLKKCAQAIMEKHEGIFPTDHASVLALPGIGDYTAGAICSICFDQPTPAVDGNVLRVVTRLMCDDSPIDEQKTKRRITQALAEIYPEKDAGDFTQSLMELGATICLPNGAPKCDLCPIAELCEARKSNTVLQYPVKKEKKARRLEERTVFIFTCGVRLAICKRKETGLLAGLWQFPNIEGKLDAQQALDTAKEFGLHIRDITSQIEHTHIFTHVQWDMRAFYMTCDNMTEEFTWATLDEIQSTYALPTAFAMFIPKE